MQFDDTTTNLGIVQEVDDLCDSNEESYPKASKVRRANSSLETLVTDIITADGVWQFDDLNNTTNPVGTATLTSGTARYNFSDKFLDIEEVDVLDSAGVYRRIKPFDPNDLDDMSVEEHFGSASGMPTHYDKYGDGIRLFPAPSSTSVTLAAGLRVRFKRTASLFTESDTTKEPGIASPFHVLVAWMTALPYCKTYKPERVAQLERDITAGRINMVRFYAHRDKDDARTMTMKSIRYR